MQIIYRCKRKGCEAVRRIEYPLARHGRHYRMDAKRGEVGAGNDHLCVCGSYARGFKIEAVASCHACDDRCMYAVGPDCECSCGGANHGRGYQVTYTETGEVLPDAQAAFAW